MNRGIRRPLPSWRASETRVARPELWLLAMALVGGLLVEVWQSARMAELSLRLDRNRTALRQTQDRLDFVRHELESRATRAELAPLASRLGLAPLDAQQVVLLPAEYLAGERGRDREGSRSSVLAWAGGFSRALVPEATARVRGN